MKKEMDGWKFVQTKFARSLVCRVNVLIFHWWERKRWTKICSKELPVHLCVRLMFWFFTDDKRNGWMKICSNEICPLIRSNKGSPLSSSVRFFGPSTQAYSQVLGPKNIAIIVYKILLHTNTNIPNGRRCLSCSA